MLFPVCSWTQRSVTLTRTIGWRSRIFLLFSETLHGLEEQIGKLIKMCRRINLKLSPTKFALSKDVKFGGTVISAEKIKGQEIIFLDPPDQRILRITEIPPYLQKKWQSYCGMISSLKQWFPNVTFANKHLNAGTTQGSTFVWTIEMQQEYEAIKLIFQNQIRLSPFNPEKPINILTDGASSRGIGFVFYQPTEISTQEVTIVQGNSSSLKESQMGYSPVDTEVLALKFAFDACQHW